MHGVRGKRQLLMNHDHSTSDRQKLPNCSAHESTASLALPTSYKTPPPQLHHCHREVDPFSAGCNITCCSMNRHPLHSSSTNNQDLHRSPGCPELPPPPFFFSSFFFLFMNYNDINTTTAAPQLEALPFSPLPISILTTSFQH